jgi:hypothetical protein
MKIFAFMMLSAVLVFAASYSFVAYKDNNCRTYCKSKGKDNGKFEVGYINRTTGAGTPSRCACS